jgi:hypothetical protein
MHSENAGKQNLGNTSFTPGANVAKSAHPHAITRKRGKTCTSSNNLARRWSLLRASLGKQVGVVARGARFMFLKEKALVFVTGRRIFDLAIFCDETDTNLIHLSNYVAPFDNVVLTMSICSNYGYLVLLKCPTVPSKCNLFIFVTIAHLWLIARS